MYQIGRFHITKKLTTFFIFVKNANFENIIESNFKTKNPRKSPTETNIRVESFDTATYEKLILSSP